MGGVGDDGLVRWRVKQDVHEAVQVGHKLSLLFLILSFPVTSQETTMRRKTFR